MQTLSKNLLIIGAGAHKPYGMPTAADLTAVIQKIYQNSHSNKYNPEELYLGMFRRLEVYADRLPALRTFANPRTNFDTALRRNAVRDNIENFLKKFCEALVPSIDAYLAQIHNSKIEFEPNLFSQVGRLVVAYLVHTHETAVPHGTREHNWIEYFIQMYVRPNPKLFFENPPQFITFNYDRIFERSIYLHLLRQHHYSENEAFSLVEKLSILHVYGDIGSYQKDIREELKDSDFYSLAIDRIRVVGEQRSENILKEVSTRIDGMIRRAAKIYFLGYGFDSINNGILIQDLKPFWEEKSLVTSTNIGADTLDRHLIEGQFGILPANLSKRHLADRIDSLALLKKYPLEQQF